MMNTPSGRSAIAAALLAAILAGCAAPEPAQAPAVQPPPAAPAPAPPAPPPPPVVEPPPPPPPPEPVKTPAQKSVAEAIALYDAGNYNGAIRTLRASRDIWSPDTPAAVKIEAHKYTAFSYCVTGRLGPCRAQFDALLRLDRSFELSPAEAGHPLWGPVFVQAKKAAQAGSRRPPAKAAPAPR